MEQISNAVKYPECWAYFIALARKFPENKLPERFGIPSPLPPYDYLYSDDPGKLFGKYKELFYKPNIESPSVYGKIQHIVTHF